MAGQPLIETMESPTRRPAVVATEPAHSEETMHSFGRVGWLMHVTPRRPECFEQSTELSAAIGRALGGGWLGGRLWRARRERDFWRSGQPRVALAMLLAFTNELEKAKKSQSSRPAGT